MVAFITIDYFSIKLYNVGMTISVSKVETISPVIKATAIGVKNELADNANGIKPTTVVIVVSIIGLNLLLTEDLHASSIDSPSCLALLIYSISNIALFTTIPIKAKSPNPAVNENG